MKLKSIVLSLLVLFICVQTMAQKKKCVSLFDGKTTKGWHTYGEATAGQAWKVEDGVLFLDATAKEGRGDISSDESFDDFHLRLEWKISKNGNSGVIFFAQDDKAKYKNLWYTGPEMQVLDNEGHSDGKIVKRTVRKRPGTVAIAAAIQHKYSIPVIPHILCGGFTKSETEHVLIDLNFLGANFQV